jgi:hypothetical protein
MKINEVIVEGIFSSVADVFSVDRYKKQDPEKRQAKIQNLFLKDFVADFYADLQANIKAGVIKENSTLVFSEDSSAPSTTSTPTPTSTSTPTSTPTINAGFTTARIEKIRPAVNRLKSDGKITNVTQLGSFLSKKYPKIWQNTKNKKEVLDDLIGPPVSSAAQGVAPGARQPSMNNWIVKWFNAYMQGVDWQQQRSTVETLAQDIANSYAKDKGKSSVERLAAVAWELTGEQNKSPRGFGNVSSSYSSRNQADTLTGKDLAQNPKKIEQFIDDRTDQELENLKKAIAKVRP